MASNILQEILKLDENLQSFVIDEIALTALLDKAWAPVGKKILKQVSSIIDFKNKQYNRQAGISFDVWLEDTMYNETLAKIWDKIEPTAKNIIIKSYDRGIQEMGENPFTLQSATRQKLENSVESVYAERKSEAIEILLGIVRDGFINYASEVAIPNFHSTIRKLEKIDDLWRTWEQQHGRPLSEDTREILRYEQARRLYAQSLTNIRGEVIDSLHESITQNKNNSILSNLATARAHHFGFLDWANDSGVEYYKIVSVLDAKTCEACAFMNGKVFSVHDGLQYKSAFLATNGDKDKIKADFPFLTKNDLDKIEGIVNTDKIAQDTYKRDSFAPVAFYFPPFHPACRCTVVAV